MNCKCGREVRIRRVIVEIRYKIIYAGDCESGHQHYEDHKDFQFFQMFDEPASVAHKYGFRITIEHGITGTQLSFPFYEDQRD